MNKFVPLLIITVLFSFGCTQSDNNQEQAKNGQETAPADNSGAQINRIKPKKDSRIIAKVNGVPIYEDELQNKDLDTLITEEILYQEGLKRGLYEKYQDRIMGFQMSLIVNDVKKSIVDDLPPEKPVYEQDIREYYDARKDKYTVLRIKEINFKDKKQGEEIEKMAAEGMTFEDIANKFGAPDSGVTVKDLGYNRSLAKQFKTKEKGSVTDVIEKRDGTYSVLKITDVQLIPMEHAKKSIRSTLESEGHAKAINDAARKIAEQDNMKVEILNNPE